MSFFSESKWTQFEDRKGEQKQCPVVSLDQCMFFPIEITWMYSHVFKFNVKGHACALSHRHIKSVPRNLMRGFCLSMFDIHMSSYCLKTFRSMRFHVYTLEPLHDILRVYHKIWGCTCRTLWTCWRVSDSKETTHQIPIGDCTGVHLQCVVIWNPKTLPLSLSSLQTHLYMFIKLNIQENSKVRL